ncbi:organic anion transporter family protein [Rhodococcus wratislaviensis]|uniref:Organic anion transporter family protein n=1 Tax=Rhodococcus wratislaviensis TaxID=44752 RepID=A0A402C3P1_RHOWR|nr:organic anion transporter family protein [Rhodococcus wratislaviensis]
MNSPVTSVSGPSTQSPAGSDPRSKQRFLIRLSALIAGGMFIDGFILGSIGLVMPALSADLNLSAAWQGLIGASALIGIFFGGPIGGYLADKVGRKPMFIVDLSIFLVGSFMQFFVDSAWQLFVIRLIMGMAIGADYAIGWPLLAEFSPARLRGKLLAFQEVAWYVGYLGSYSLGYVMSSALDLDWRIILGMSTIPSLIVFLLRLGTPESPRWLISKGRVEEGLAIAHEYMEEDDVRELQNEKRVETSFRRLFSPPVPQRHDLRLRVLGLQCHPLLRHRHLRSDRSRKSRPRRRIDRGAAAQRRGRRRLAGRDVPHRTGRAPQTVHPADVDRRGRPDHHRPVLPRLTDGHPGVLRCLLLRQCHLHRPDRRLPERSLPHRDPRRRGRFRNRHLPNRSRGRNVHPADVGGELGRGRHHDDRSRHLRDRCDRLPLPRSRNHGSEPERGVRAGE